MKKVINGFKVEISEEFNKEEQQKILKMVLQTLKKVKKNVR